MISHSICIIEMGYHPDFQLYDNIYHKSYKELKLGTILYWKYSELLLYFKVSFTTFKHIVNVIDDTTRNMI